MTMGSWAWWSLRRGIEYAAAAQGCASVARHASVLLGLNASGSYSMDYDAWLKEEEIQSFIEWDSQQ